MPINIKGGNIFNAPTNPYLSDTSPTDGDRIYTAITTEDTSVSITGWGGTITENSNLNTTKGFRIKCYDSLTTTGIRFNPTATNLNDNDFFVLIYSDKPYQHHFAKITEVLTEDEYGDAFEFEPKLGNEIPKDTKFIIFQMTKNGSVVAISMGMLQDNSLGTSSNDFEGELWQRMAVARPLFYFPARESNLDGMDKPNELNHNRKFYAIRESGTANSYTLSNADNCKVFTTMQDFGKSVVDYSRFSYKIKLTDKLRDLDAAQASNCTYNEGGTITTDTTNYQQSHINARRVADDILTSPIFTGPLRYLSYDFSPTKSNLVHGVYDHTNTEAIDGKGGFSETSIVDNNRIMPRKIKEFDAYRVRHTVHRGETNEFFALKATYDSSATDVAFTFNTEYDLKTVLNAGDEVKLGNDILFVDDDGSGNPAISTLSGTTQTITFEHNATRVYARTESEGKFTLKSITPTSGETLHRRAYNATDGTLMLDTKLLNGRFSKMYVAFTSLNQEQRFATITACDATKGMITLSFSDDSYTANPLSFIRGQYQLLIERFNGEVENIESKKQDGQTIMEIQGRDKFSKLLSPIVNLNTLFSDDVIYSTNSPYNKLGNVRAASTFTITLGQETWQTTIPCDSSNTGPNFDNFPIVGTKLFTANGYVGEVLTSSLYSHGGGPARQYTITPALTEANSEAIYMDIEKNYILSKALGSSHLATNKTSSLTGAANKGLIFTSGNKIKRVSLTATTNGNTTVNISATGEDTSDLEAGMIISGHSGIPMGTKIVSVVDASTITISASATNSAAEAGTIFFGGEDTSLVSTSANTSEGAIGYAINKPSSISNDFAFQSLLKDEHGSAGSSSFDTVNTLIDFEVVSTSKKDNITEIELAPYIPITLGRKVDYDFDIDDFTFSDVGPVSSVGVFASSKIWFFFTSSSTGYSLKRDDILFVGDSSSTTTTGTKTFIGKVIEIQPYTDSGTHSIQVVMDRGIRAFSVGEKIYLATKKSNDLIFVNGKHMWGGKINTHPHPTVSSSLGVLPLNVESANGSADNNAKYGQMYYKSKDFALGTFSNDTGIITSILNNTQVRKLYNNPSLLNFFTSNYQFKPNISAENLISFDTTDSSYRTMPIDLRGFRNPYGSKTNSRRIHRTENISLPKDSNNPIFERTYGSQDESAERLFLYIISDLLPYSSLRKDSLMDGNKNLNNYNLFLLENKQKKDNSITETNRLSLSDSNFQSINFIDNFDVSSLKRFGLMRLTEVCVDFLFNKVNPEKDIDTKNNFGTNSIGIFDIVALNNNGAIDASATSGTTLTFDDNQTIAINTKIYDSNGYFIGQTASAGTNTKAFTLAANVRLTNNGSIATNAVVVGDVSVNVFGRNNKNTFDALTSGVHPLKVCVIPEGSTYVASPNTSDELVLPIGFASSVSATISAADSTSISALSNILANINDDQFQGMVGVCLDRFEIEEGGALPIEKGSTTQALFGLETITSNSKLFLTLKSFEHFKEHKNIGDTGSSYITSATYAVDGAYMAFKLRLLTPSSLTESNITSSNGTVKKTTINSSGSGNLNNFLREVDITGCYLVPETGKSVDGTTITTGNFTSSKRMNNINPSTLIYVISHEVNSSNANQHFLITDTALSASTAYRILQPNETCIYDFFPPKLNLNVLSSSYTKMSGEDKVYDTKQSYSFQHGSDSTADNTVENEGILSMFVMVDTDKQSTDNSLVLKDPSNFISTNLPDGEYSLYYTDGDNGKKIETTTITESDDFVSLTLKEPFNGKGIVSVSEPFVISSNQELKIDPTRACIGSTVSVGLEGEDLINELLEQEGIEFTTTSTDTPMYLAPNYQGVDLYSAIRYILDRKDMKLVEENNVFKIIPEDEDSLRTNITIDDSDEFFITDFDKVSTLFDFFNEVNVYGNAHKAVRKDLRSIEKRGRKTLEVVDNTLLTQEEVDKRATKLLRIHSRLNQKLSFTLHSTGISQLRVGDIVNVSIPRENIEMNEYIVLEMEHQISGFIKLQLGRYSKDLSDVFSELLISSKETKAALRSDELTAQEVSFNFLDTVDTKEIKLLVRKRSATGTTLGFATPLGFGLPIGFGGGTITITDLIDEDLA